jgi:glycine dehydrogenase subunit 1
MRYLPNTDEDRAALLARVGVASIDDLFADIPAGKRLSALVDLPTTKSEIEVERILGKMAAKNVAAVSVPFFVGAGAYRHHVPASVDHLIQRSEFLTSYTPYQPEIAQGTLQYLFEFQTQVANLTAMEVANASMYDGSTATTEAVLMAERITSRRRVLVARSLHPEYRDVLRTYARHSGLVVEEIGYTQAGTLDMKALQSSLRDDVCAVVLQSPNFFGAIEEIEPVAKAAHLSGSLLVTAIAEAMSLGVINPPIEADIVAMEGQSFGLPPSYGGPFVGVLASKDRFVRQMPGRLVGQTTDQDGRRGFVLTLATREQHIRREKATSNICTNQALCALAATVHMTLLGKEGLREMAEQNLSKAHYALGELEKIAGVKRTFLAPFFNEFTVEFPRSVKMVNVDLLKEKIIGPFVLGSAYPELSKHALVCVTETTSRAEIDRFVVAVQSALSKPL